MAAILILTTASTQEEAARIAEALVTEKLAACVQTAPIESWYRWDGKIERAAEIRLHIKTSEHCADAVEQRIAALHSYELPELVCIPIAGGSPDYLAWIAQSVGP
jgi:periplasmic divalent cation tolerance protein